MNIDTTALRSQLRGLSARLEKIDDQQRALRAEQLEQLRVAVAHRGTISEIARASGLSRAYLHKIRLHEARAFADAPAILNAAIKRVEEIRRQLAQLDDDAAAVRASRDSLIRELGVVLKAAAIAKDAGITGERVRIILQDTGADG